MTDKAVEMLILLVMFICGGVSGMIIEQFVQRSGYSKLRKERIELIDKIMLRVENLKRCYLLQREALEYYANQTVWCSSDENGVHDKIDYGDVENVMFINNDFTTQGFTAGKLARDTLNDTEIKEPKNEHG